MSKYHQKRVSEILKQIKYATVATASPDGKPWNSPVAHFFDKDFNIYWFSDKKSVHSTNIRNNGQIFIVIYDSTMPEGTGEAVYIEAIAQEINDVEEATEIIDLQPGPIKVTLESSSGDAIHRFYKATPLNVWLNDDEKDENGNYIKDIRIKMSLEELKSKYYETV